MSATLRNWAADAIEVPPNLTTLVGAVASTDRTLPMLLAVLAPLLAPVLVLRPLGAGLSFDALRRAGLRSCVALGMSDRPG